MIGRYSTEAMDRVWSDEAKWERWRQVELAVLRARGLKGLAGMAAVHPAGDVDEWEAETHHDLVAFLRSWTEQMAPGIRQEVHFGLTSSDVVDTALGMAVREAGGVISDATWELARTLAGHAADYERTVRVARTHGRPAEVSSWGLLVDDVAMAALRAHRDHRLAFRAASVAKVSGPVGTYAELGREVEVQVARALGLSPSRTSTQVVSRDRIAAWASSMVGLLGVCERFALQVRLLARDGELSEGRADESVGSSAMPQKRNPVTSEKICGLARVGRGSLIPLLESVALWDERDISHSSVERTCLVDLSTVTHYVLIETTRLVRELVVHADVMRSHVHHDYVDLLKHWALCRMLERGVDRWEAHRQLQDVHLVAELEQLAGQPEPGTAWFLRNALDTEANPMV